MRLTLLLLLVLGCSDLPSGTSNDDASVDVFVQTLTATTSSGTSPVASSPFSIPSMTRDVAMRELAARLRRSDRSWMWAATIIPANAVEVPDETPALPAPPQYGLARTTDLARVSLFQSVGIDIAREGAEVPASSPVIAGRGLRVRAYLEGGVGSLVLGRLRWESGDATTLFVSSMHVERTSADADPESLFEFQVPAELVQEGSRFAVDILEDRGDSFAEASHARFPMDGQVHALGVEASMHIDVRVVPIRYGFDGSGRVPDVSEAQVTALREHIEAVFPVTDASVSVLSPRDYNAQIRRDNFDDHVDALTQVAAWRAGDAPPSATYYVGLVAPQASFREYCSLGCYAGVAPLNETNSAFQRAALVVWYGATTSGWTAIHELGHTLGRAHVPCGSVAGEDPDYPYAGGEVGVWGFDQRSGSFIEPTSHDFMSYCSDEWVSDYTYAAMAQRVRSTRSLPSTFAQIPDGTRRLITTGGRLRWSNVSLPAGVVGEPTELIAIDTTGRRRTVPAERIRYSIHGSSSYAVRVDPDISAFIVDGERLAVPLAM